MTVTKNHSRIMIWIGCLIGYIFYGLSGIFFITFIVPLSVIFIPFGILHYVFLNFTLRTYCAFLTRIFLPATQIYYVKEISGFEQIPKGRPVVIVANHRGKLDALFLLGILKNTAAVIKLKYATLPVYSTFVKRLNFVSLDQHSRETLEKAVIRAKEVLSNGKNLLIFPEGTRASSKRLLPFKEFAFRIAREKETEIVPIVIHSDLTFMGKSFSSFFPEKKNSYTIRCLAPVKPLNNEHSVGMAARVREIMIKELAEIGNRIQ